MGKIKCMNELTPMSGVVMKWVKQAGYKYFRLQEIDKLMEKEIIKI